MTRTKLDEVADNTHYDKPCTDGSADLHKLFPVGCWAKNVLASQLGAKKSSRFRG